MNNEIKIGTKIKALIDYPDGGTVRKGEVGIIIENNIAAFPSQKRYYVDIYTLNKNKYEVVSEEFLFNTSQYGRWYKALVDNPVSILYLKKGDYAKSDGVDSFLEFSNGSKNVKWACSKFRNDLWELMPEGFEPNLVTNKNELTDLSKIQPYLPEGHPDKIDTIPEYVECIVSKRTTMFTVGKIYNFPNPVDNGGEKRGVTLKGNIWEFKPSTKEAYDAQENSKIKDMEKSEFKKGEYIVLIDTPHIIEPYPKNYIFKQRETNNYLVSVLDSEGSKINGWFPIRYSSKYWRYATPEEITEYERLGKPYDVTTLNKSNIKKWSIGTYVVFVKEGYYGLKHCLTSYKISEIGSIGKISSYYESETITACKKEGNDISRFVFEKDLVKWFATKEEAETFAKTLINKNTLQQLPQKAKPKIAITDIPTTQPIVIKLNKKINYLIPKSI